MRHGCEGKVRPHESFVDSWWLSQSDGLLSTFDTFHESSLDGSRSLGLGASLVTATSAFGLHWLARFPPPLLSTSSLFCAIDMKRIISLLFIPIYKHVQDIHLSSESKSVRTGRNIYRISLGKFKSIPLVFVSLVVQQSFCVNSWAIKIHFRVRRATIGNNNGTV